MAERPRCVPVRMRDTRTANTAVQYSSKEYEATRTSNVKTKKDTVGIYNIYKHFYKHFVFFLYIR